ncbi:MAG: nucleotidyltransferase domain-containing protein [Dermatophilaceae bacterium]
MFTFNRDHLAAGPVVELAQLASTLVERLKGLIRSWQVQPQHAYLFGSAARQDGDASSDVDILRARRSSCRSAYARGHSTLRSLQLTSAYKR